MHRVRRSLKLRQNEFLFFGSTEFGSTERGHLHLLLSFDGLRTKGKTELVEKTNSLMPISVEILSAEVFRDRLRIGCESVAPAAKDQRLLLSYVCKKEAGHEYKHCFFSGTPKEFQTTTIG